MKILLLYLVIEIHEPIRKVYEDIIRQVYCGKVYADIIRSTMSSFLAIDESSRRDPQSFFDKPEC